MDCLPSHNIKVQPGDCVLVNYGEGISIDRRTDCPPQADEAAEAPQQPPRTSDRFESACRQSTIGRDAEPGDGVAEVPVNDHHPALGAPAPHLRER